MNVSSSDNTILLRTGRFYSIYETHDHLIMEDKTKSGLEAKYGTDCDSGIVYDGGGTGYKVGIKWYFRKITFNLDQIVKFGEDLDERYNAIREMTCPDD